MVPYVEAIASSILGNLALVVQAVDARKAPSSLAMKPGLLFHLMRRGLWMAGNGMNIGAAILQVYAMKDLPVAVVQSILSGGILLVPFSSMWMLKERPTSRDWAALGAIVAGLGLAISSTPPQDAQLTVSVWTVFAVSLAVCAFGLLAARYLKNVGTLVAAGVCMGFATVLSKVVSLPSVTGVQMVLAIALLVGSGSIGFLAQMTALQTMSPARVGPVVLAANTALPIFAAPALFSERWPQAHLTVLATCIVIVAAAYLASRPLQVAEPILPQPVSS